MEQKLQERLTRKIRSRVPSSPNPATPPAKVPTSAANCSAWRQSTSTWMRSPVATRWFRMAPAPGTRRRPWLVNLSHSRLMSGRTPLPILMISLGNRCPSTIPSSKVRLTQRVWVIITWMRSHHPKCPTSTPTWPKATMHSCLARSKPDKTRMNNNLLTTTSKKATTLPINHTAAASWINPTSKVIWAERGIEIWISSQWSRPERWARIELVKFQLPP